MIPADRMDELQRLMEVAWEPDPVEGQCRDHERHVQGGNMNIAIVRGTLDASPLINRSAAGVVSIQYKITADHETVPVVWPDAPKRAEQLNPGDEVFIIGHVRCRRFTAGGGTASRTEIVAHDVALVTLESRLDAAKVLLAAISDTMT